jgi:hypothetical protein
MSMSNHIKSISFTRESNFRGYVTVEGNAARIDEDGALTLAAPFAPAGWSLDCGADKIDDCWVVTAYREEVQS